MALIGANAQRYRVAAREELARVASMAPTAPELAALRLTGTFDAAMREALPDRHLFALADRIAADAMTAADRALIAAFSIADLKAANITAAAFIMASAALIRAVAAVMRRTTHAPDPPETTAHAAAVIAAATATLRERLQALPDTDELARLGGMFMHGAMTPADIVVIRALPGPYLRANAAAGHWPVFVDYRLRDC